jgi:hypothetical protein
MKYGALLPTTAKGLGLDIVKGQYFNDVTYVSVISHYFLVAYKSTGYSALRLET